MSERILRALMQLFAIVAKVDEVIAEEDDASSADLHIKSTKGVAIIEAFLKAELSSADVNKYLHIFNDFLNETRGKLYAKAGGQKRTSLQSVKVLRICEQINKELTQRQKFIVLIRIFEFIYADNLQSEREDEFVKTVADSFHIDEEEFVLVREFIENNGQQQTDKSNHVFYRNEVKGDLSEAIEGRLEGLDGTIHVIYIPSVKTIFFRYFGDEELYVNGQIVANDKTHVFNVGSTIRTTKSSQLFYSDIISKVKPVKDHQKISFEVHNIHHSFSSGKEALRKISFSSNEGKLIGIMGGSGTGKTTLLNIMNGKVNPSLGTLEINGINLHDNPELLEGVVGNVSQDDLLIEELTVFENLFYSARLCMGGFDDASLAKKVIDLLKAIGLYEIRFLKVGSVLDKVISGGQRKRLNIALELIREPSILFVDEPTSGLSSRDSENIMDLLKELSLNGKLVFVVIHQPSSTIFKLFDRLLIMDVGGYLIYDGIPLNAIAHFKIFSFRGNAHERECSLCGNVNSEQIFNIIDSRIVDEYGNETGQRKKDPKDWHELYLRHKPDFEVEKNTNQPAVNNKLPSRISQYATYLVRDLYSKKSNTQYLLVNSLVSPGLALVLSFFIKYFDRSTGVAEYSFFSNQNIPQYIFIAVVVAIFLGLTVSAEEINKDKQILARERFLHLSRSSYLFAKITLLFAISAVQSALFVLIGNLVLEIEGMYLSYWLILFSTFCASNLAGLNISSAFNSAKVIYIIVPLIIIPQLLFSGVIVKFDKLHPSLSDATKVPWIGEMMVSRWAYEAITVNQQSNNQLEKDIFQYKASKSKAKWQKDYWIPELNTQMNYLCDPKKGSKQKELARSILIHEIREEEERLSNLSCRSCISDLEKKTMNKETDYTAIRGFLDTIKLNANIIINRNNALIQDYIRQTGEKEYLDRKLRYTNESLEDLLTNRMDENKLIIHEGAIYQTDDPVYNDPKGVSFFSTHFYAPYKYIFGIKIQTFYANLLIIWVISILSYIILYFDLLRVVLDRFSDLFWRYSKKKTPQ